MTENQKAFMQYFNAFYGGNPPVIKNPDVQKDTSDKLTTTNASDCWY